MRSLEEELGSRSSAAAGASSSAGEAVLRAEAAEARARALEAEAENLGKQVALLQVGAVQWVGVGGMSCCVAAAGSPWQLLLCGLDRGAATDSNWQRLPTTN